MKIQCVSRLHVELIVDENGDVTIMNRSVNGTVLNGTLLGKGGTSSLKHNDKFVVGNREFRFSKETKAPHKSSCFAPAGPDEVTAELSSTGFSPFRKARQSIGVALAVRRHDTSDFNFKSSILIRLFQFQNRWLMLSRRSARNPRLTAVVLRPLFALRCQRLCLRGSNSVCETLPEKGPKLRSHHQRGLVKLWRHFQRMVDPCHKHCGTEFLHAVAVLPRELLLLLPRHRRHRQQQ